MPLMPAPPTPMKCAYVPLTRSLPLRRGGLGHVIGGRGRDRVGLGRRRLGGRFRDAVRQRAGDCLNLGLVWRVDPGGSPLLDAPRRVHRPRRDRRLGDGVCGIGLGEGACRRCHRRAPDRVGEQTHDLVPERGAVESAVRDDDGAPASMRGAALSVWWSSVAKGYGTSTDGRPSTDSSAIVVAPARHTTRSAAAMASPMPSM